ncbi:MAG: MCE family protein [Deltaproteobacteria bacterium]|nr:MCE family protein [Deltaproteobacteria bacterium]
MEEGFTRKEQLAGGFLLVLIVFTMVTLLVIAQGKGWFHPQKTYLLQFRQGYNLRQGSLVKMFNAEIGKVAMLGITQTGGHPQVEVTIKVNEEYANLIRQDSVAEVVSPTLIGSEYVEISPGSSGYPKIEPYGTIPSRERKSVTEHLAELASEENIQKVKHMLINLAKFSEDLKNDEKVLLAALNHLDEVLKNLAEGKGTLGMLVMQKDLYNRMNQALDHMDKFLVEAKILLVDLKPTTQNLGVFTQSINQEIEPLKAIVANIKAGSEELPDLLEAATGTARSAKDTMDAIKANPLIRWTAPAGAKSQTIHVAPRTLP